MIVDNCLQIFGGYGFIEEYPIAMAYRDDRINRIWEGTNEINRSIITGYLMKNVLMEEISLRDIIQTKEDIISKIAILEIISSLVCMISLNDISSIKTFFIRYPVIMDLFISLVPSHILLMRSSL